MNKYLEKIALSGSVQAHLKDIKGNTKKRKAAAEKERAAEKDIQKIMNEMAQRIKKTKTSEEEYKNVLKGTESLGKLYTTLKKGSQQMQTKAAGWNEFTGKHVNENRITQKVLSQGGPQHVELTNKYIKSLEPGLVKARNASRMRVGAVGGAVVAAGGYGLHKFRKKQTDHINQIQQEIYDENLGTKTASYHEKLAGRISNLIDSGINAVGKGLKGVNEFGKQVNGSHIKEFNEAKKVGFKAVGKEPEYIDKLHDQSRGAKLALGGIGAAGLYGYHRGKKSATPDYSQQTYY